MTLSLPFKAILWDMDGVLVDTFEAHFHAWSCIFAELDHPFTLDDFRRTFGMNNRSILKTLLEVDLPEEEFHAVSNRKEVYFRESVRTITRFLPGVTKWLQHFQALGLPQAVASSAPQENITALLDELDAHQWFSAVVSGAKLSGKPDPAVFLLAASQLEVEPVDCLVIEDAVPGVEAAKRGGMRCIAVLTTNPPEALQQADLIVPDLSHLTLDMLADLKK